MPELEVPWSFTFLPDDSILITERKGELIHFKNGKKHGKFKMIEKDGTTIRVYTDKKEYHEEAGFTLWGGMWGNSGKLAPLPPKESSHSKPEPEETISVDDLPF